MSLVRPPIRAFLVRRREVIAAGLIAVFGVWLMVLGGWFLTPLGALVIAFAVGWVVIALRRMRFLRGISAPGMVEVDEGQVGYFGPAFGGFVALADLDELRLSEMGGTLQWRLKTLGNEVLLVPVTATGAEKLFDAFAALPGIDMAAISAALERGVGTLPLWRRRKLHPAAQIDHQLS
jgi:hypothetical protein